MALQMLGSILHVSSTVTQQNNLKLTDLYLTCMSLTNREAHI